LFKERLAADEALIALPPLRDSPPPWQPARSSEPTELEHWVLAEAGLLSLSLQPAAAAELVRRIGNEFRRLKDPLGRLVSLVVDNGTYGTIRMHQERDYPGRVSGSDLFNPDFVALARAYGWDAHRVDVTEQFEPAFAAAMAAERPTLIHIKLDTDVITSRTTLAAIRETALRRVSS